MRIEWDPNKAASNLRKHGVDFADAVEALHDELALTIEDPDAEGERRYVSIGVAARGHTLVVVFAWRDESLRIISARRARPRERRAYEERA